MSDTDTRSPLYFLAVRAFIGLLIVIVLGIWMLLGMQMEATASWLTIEVAIAVSGGALVLWFVASLVKSRLAKGSGLRPREPGR